MNQSDLYDSVCIRLSFQNFSSIVISNECEKSSLAPILECPHYESILHLYYDKH